MAAEVKKEIELEIAYVLFIDIVGYSKLLINEQRRLLEVLNQIVKGTDQFRTAEANGRLLTIPTGDGMALVFYNTPEAPVECALEIGRADKAHPELSLRMGVHSGPISGVVDVNGRANVAGAGINIAQRVMDCGDAGHILLSKHVAEDLEQYGHWRPHLHDLGECEVKHGARLSIVNLYTEELGNPEVPQKLRHARAKAAPQFGAEARPGGKGWMLVAAAAILILALVGGLLLWQRRAAPSARSGPSPIATPVAANVPVVPEKSIAVLPFENLSDEKQNAYFADGVQDEILTDLSKVADLKVISRTSVMPYKSGVARNLREIGKQLGVAHLLEGSVQRAAGRIRVNAQLIDARTDAHLWAQTYDRDLADIFAIQSEVAKAIADQLQATILPREKLTIEKQPTKDIAAYDFYVRAKEAFDVASYSDDATKSLLQAIGLFEQAIGRDPTFLAAYCSLARAHDQLYLFGGDHTPARLAAAEEAINAALRLQPDAAEAHLALANHFYSKLDYEGARAEIEMARRTLPNDPRAFELSGYADRRQGRWQESTRNLERALELDPNNIFILQQISESYASLRDYSKGVAALDRVLSLKPNDLNTRISRAQLEVIWKADTAPLHEILESFMRENPYSRSRFAGTRLFLAFAERDASGGLRALADLGQNTYGPDAIQYPRAYGEGIFARLNGDVVAAETSFTKARAAQQKIVDAQPDYGPALCVLGLIDAGLGRKEDALREGRRAAELIPPTKDSINGAHIMNLLAMIYAWVGEKDLAIEQLTRALQLPGSSNYGYLRLFPQWDPLRGDPRFEQIVASLAPKDTKR